MTGEINRATIVDKLVGERIRALRMGQGLSQSDLADMSGVTYQQIHKYEHGINRLSVGRAAIVAKALGVPISALFEEVEKKGESNGEQDEQNLLHMKVARYFSNIRNPHYREAIYRFIRAIAEEKTRGND